MRRDAMHEASGEPSPTNLVLRSSPNWTAIAFLAALGGLHLSIWALAGRGRKNEAYMSLIFGCTFLAAALACYMSTFEMVVIPSERRVRVRSGCRRLRVERSIPFAKISAVRLTLNSNPRDRGGRVELLCGNEAIACPPTPIARIEALCLAITMGVRLIKVSDDGALAVTRRSGARSVKVDEQLPAK